MITIHTFITTKTEMLNHTAMKIKRRVLKSASPERSLCKDGDQLFCKINIHQTSSCTK